MKTDMMKNKLLLVEDDLNFGTVLKSYLELNDLQVEWIDDGKKAFPAFEKGNFNLVLLDVMLPNMDGFSIARQIRDSGADVPFIFITAKTLREDIVEGYKTGADDYITKPFDSEILLYKIKAILTRTTGTPNDLPGDQFTFGKFEFDHKSRTLTEIKSGKKQSLSPKESELLKMLIEYKGEVLPKSLALNKIWGEANYFTTRSMDVYIAKLRKFLTSDPSIRIVTLHGAGYRLISR
jgi:DNA-binding response OmpR family regulator